MIAYFIGVRAVLEGMISPSLVDLVEQIRSGAFDYVLLKPVDAQVMVSASRYEPWKMFDLLGAIALVDLRVRRSAARARAPADLALGVVLFVAGVLAMYALWIVCAAASFWVVRLDNLMYLLGAIFDTARWPVQVFRGAWRFVFTFVIPVAVMTTYPGDGAARHGSTRATALATIGGALALLVDQPARLAHGDPQLHQRVELTVVVKIRRRRIELLLEVLIRSITSRRACERWSLSWSFQCTSMSQRMSTSTSSPSSEEATSSSGLRRARAPPAARAVPAARAPRPPIRRSSSSSSWSSHAHAERP